MRTVNIKHVAQLLAMTEGSQRTSLAADMPALGALQRAALVNKSQCSCVLHTLMQPSKRHAQHVKQKCTLTSLSQPAETMMGLLVTGLKRTQDTHSVWPSGSPMVYLHSPRVFHSLIVLSREPDTICKAKAQQMRARTLCLHDAKGSMIRLTSSGLPWAC